MRSVMLFDDKLVMVEMDGASDRFNVMLPCGSVIGSLDARVLVNIGDTEKALRQVYSCHERREFVREFRRTDPVAAAWFLSHGPNFTAEGAQRRVLDDRMSAAELYDELRQLDNWTNPIGRAEPVDDIAEALDRLEVGGKVIDLMEELKKSLGMPAMHT